MRELSQKGRRWGPSEYTGSIGDYGIHLECEIMLACEAPMYDPKNTYDKQRLSRTLRRNTTFYARARTHAQ